MINQGMFTSKTDLWETPKDLFNEYDAVFNFNTDVCALPINAKCDHFFSPENDGLKQDWRGACWMNPPYGKEISKWVQKAYNESCIKNQCFVVALLPARTDTKWFHDFIYNQNGVEIRFLKGRLKFGQSKNSAPFPSMIVIFNY